MEFCLTILAVDNVVFRIEYKNHTKSRMSCTILELIYQI